MVFKHRELQPGARQETEHSGDRRVDSIAAGTNPTEYSTGVAEVDARDRTTFPDAAIGYEKPGGDSEGGLDAR